MVACLLSEPEAACLSVMQVEQRSSQNPPPAPLSLAHTASSSPSATAILAHAWSIGHGPYGGGSHAARKTQALRSSCDNTQPAEVTYQQ